MPIFVSCFITSSYSCLVSALTSFLSASCCDASETVIREGDIGEGGGDGDTKEGEEGFHILGTNASGNGSKDNFYVIIVTTIISFSHVVSWLFCLDCMLTHAFLTTQVSCCANSDLFRAYFNIFVRIWIVLLIFLVLSCFPFLREIL